MPVRGTLIGFGWVGSSLLILSSSPVVVVPLRVGAKVTVIVLEALGSTVNALSMVEKVLRFGSVIVTVTFNGPVPVLPTTTEPSTGTLSEVFSLRRRGDTMMRPCPGVAVAVGVWVIVAVGDRVAVAVAVAVGVRVVVAVGVRLIVAVGV